MILPPIVLGLTICEKAIVEEGTRNVTIVSTFTRLVVDEFPSPPQRFSVYSVLTEGLGDATILLTVTNLEADLTMNKQPESPRDSRQGNPDSANTILVVVDGPEDTTRRPRPANHPLHPPGQQPPSKEPPQERPPANYS
jgi:hypothetical protein